MAKTSRFLHDLAARVAAGMSIRAAAAEVGCSERQGYSLASKPEFQQIVTATRTEAVQRAADILSDNATQAATALVGLLKSDDEKIVLQAASKLLATLQPMQELAELRNRLDALERRDSATTFTVAAG